MHRFGSAMLDMALPPRCHLCRRYIAEAGQIHICPACRDTLPLVSSPCCSRCGRPFDGAGDDHPCGACLHQPPPWESARAALLYDGACRELIHAFKYRHRFHLRRCLALMTQEQLTPFATQCRADLLMAVPLHHSKLRQRGFNQALLVAELLANFWRLPLNRHTLQRTHATVSQTELSAEQRFANLRDAFAVTNPATIKDQRILLVDDVFTTGATLAACSRCLLRAGAAAVCCVTIARAPDPAS